MSKTLLSTNQLSKSFMSGALEQHVLKDLDIEIYAGDFTVIMGPSGAGKSTLLYALSGMDKPTHGQVIFDGKDISGLNNDQLALFRRKHCGFVFQQIYLLDNMSVMDNVLASGLLTRKRKKELTQEAGEMFEQVGITRQTWRKSPSQLSGGEAQRVGIIRALINHPRIAFADEPTGSLNSSFGAAVLDMLTEVNQKGQSIVMVTHDIKSALRGNRVVYLKDGVICGECLLGEYRLNHGAQSSGSYAEKDRERHNKLQGFLTEMGW